MSNQRPRPASDADGRAPTSSALDAMIGLTMPAACPDCDAYSTMQRDQASGIYLLAVHHDDSCPWYCAYRAGLVGEQP